MAKRKPNKRPRKKVEVATYTDPEGNVLTLRKALSPATIAMISGQGPAKAATSQEDTWQRHEELLFERLVVGWEIAGLPLEGQKMLLARLRMAAPEERRWIRETLRTHIDTWIPGL